MRRLIAAIATLYLLAIAALMFARHVRRPVTEHITITENHPRYKDYVHELRR